MRILTLTPETEARLMKLRERDDLAARRIAAQIVTDVRRRGDTALNAWSRKLDGVDLGYSGLWVSRSELAAARKRVGREFLRAVNHAAANVRRVAEQQMPREWSLQVERGVRVRQIVRPIESIGCYIPGGRFALISTLVMTVVPARVAGVRRIVAACAHANDELLAARDAPCANRRSAGDSCAGLWNQAGGTCRQDFWTRQSLRHCGEADCEHRMR